MRTIAILGPGGVGGFLAAALGDRGEPVLVIARAATAEVIARDGIDVDSVHLGRVQARPRVATTLEEPVEALIVATKATTLEPALERVGSEPALVVPLLNGLEHMQVLRRRFGHERVAAGVIRIESTADAPGRIRQTSPSVRVDLATGVPELRSALDRLAGTLERAGVPAQVQASEAQVLWSKLTRLVALACTTSASAQPIGFIRADPVWRHTLIAAIDEATAVANAEGAEIDPAAPLAELEAAHAELGSSMQRDIAAGREPELDAIAGAVIRAGNRHGLECPTLAELSRQISERVRLAQARA